MTIEHSQLSGTALHNSKVLTFTGDPSAFTPPEAGILVECLTAPNAGKTYTTTGTTPGALRLHQGTGAPGTPATVSIDNVVANPAEVTVAVSNSGTASNAVLDFEFNFSGLGGGSTVPLIAAPPSAPPDPLPPTGTAALALETSSPPTLWVYSSEWAYVTLTILSTLDPAAAAYLDRLSGTYTPEQQTAINTLVVALKGRTLAAGGSQWDSLQGLWLRALATIDDSRLNLKGVDYPLLDVNPGTFTPYEGMLTDPTSAPQNFKAEINPALFGSKQRGTLGVYLDANPSHWGMLAGVGLNHYLKTYDNTDLETEWDGSVYPYLTSGGSGGAVSVSRDATWLTVARNQASLTSAPNTLDATVQTFVEFGVLSGVFGGGNAFAQFRACWAGFGVGWTEAEVLAFHADIEACLDAFGAGVMP